MPKFGTRSKNNLSEAHQDLQKLFNEVIKYFDCSVIEGYRGEEEQNRYYHAGKSKAKFPYGMHNQKPSRAVDVIPYPVVWTDEKRIYMFVGFVRGIASTLGIKIRCGADWDGDTEVKDQNFHDLPHFELV